MEALANVHGEVVPLADAKVSVLDRGFLFGDAVYEVLRVYRGRVWLEHEHFQRLGHSLAAIRIGGVDLERLRQRMYQTLRAGSFGDALVYIQITRGASQPRKHAFPKDAVASEVLWVQEFTDPYRQSREEGAKVITHADLRWHRCDIKSTNLLGNVLAMQAAVEAGAVEALLYLADGTLTEGSHSSFFAVMDGALLTTPHQDNILPGTTKGLVQRLAQKAQVPVKEHRFKKQELPRAQELFLTGTTAEVLPIVRVEELVVADGKPGPITRRLQQAFADEVREFVK